LEHASRDGVRDAGRNLGTEEQHRSLPGAHYALQGGPRYRGWPRFGSCHSGLQVHPPELTPLGLATIREAPTLIFASGPGKSRIFSTGSAQPLADRRVITLRRQPSLRNFTVGQVCFCIDRKSTRLNSSHVAISYAVFCLKKKKKQNLIDIIEQLKNITTASTLTT